MADSISLVLQPRASLGRKNGPLRRMGITPVHLYGHGIESRSLQCDNKALVRTLVAAGGATPVSITISGEEGNYLAFVREIQRDPVIGGILHVDFLYTEASQVTTAEVPIELIGDSPGAKAVSGMVVQLLRTVRIEALPLDMPRSLQFDLSALADPQDVLRAGNLDIPNNATLVGDPSALIAQIEAARVSEESSTTLGDAVAGTEEETPDQNAGDGS